MVPSSRSPPNVLSKYFLFFLSVNHTNYRPWRP
jgi:hypothetical protein